MVGDDPLGEMPKHIHPEDAERKAQHMRALLNADIWEEERAQAVFAMNSELDADWERAVWRYLNSRERSAWKAYLDQAKAYGRTVNPF